MRITGFRFLNSKLDIVDAHTFFKRLAGLMGKKGLKNNEGMLIRPCSSIHTCFMRFPIDVVFLNDNYKVIEIAKNMTPWQFSANVKIATQVLELRAGTVDRLSIKKDMIFEVA